MSYLNVADTCVQSRLLTCSHLTLLPIIHGFIESCKGMNAFPYSIFCILIFSLRQGCVEQLQSDVQQHFCLKTTGSTLLWKVVKAAEAEVSGRPHWLFLLTSTGRTASPRVTMVGKCRWWAWALCRRGRNHRTSIWEDGRGGLWGGPQLPRAWASGEAGPVPHALQVQSLQMRPAPWQHLWCLDPLPTLLHEHMTNLSFPQAHFQAHSTCLHPSPPLKLHEVYQWSFSFRSDGFLKDLLLDFTLVFETVFSFTVLSSLASHYSASFQHIWASPLCFL